MRIGPSENHSVIFTGKKAADGTRTRNQQLGRLLLYH